MRHIRLGEQVEEQRNLAATGREQSVSEIICDAAHQKRDDLPDKRLDRRLVDVVGTVHGRGGSARETGSEFVRILKRKNG
ncbi:MAG: hypothetical protein HUU22_05635 [Phycisphaerae bacterium]|nr:hypothetical protein [Phycisphaerae bacterium]NUQ45494.1 hypothetical protein [Phycisphaerae bacterium]